MRSTTTTEYEHYESKTKAKRLTEPLGPEIPPLLLLPSALDYPEPTTNEPEVEMPPERKARMLLTLALKTVRSAWPLLNKIGNNVAVSLILEQLHEEIGVMRKRFPCNPKS